MNLQENIAPVIRENCFAFTLSSNYDSGSPLRSVCDICGCLFFVSLNHNFCVKGYGLSICFLHRSSCRCQLGSQCNQVLRYRNLTHNLFQEDKPKALQQEHHKHQPHIVLHHNLSKHRLLSLHSLHSIARFRPKSSFLLRRLSQRRAIQRRW